MSAIPSPRKVEALLQRMVERPFLRRAPFDLPLLKANLRRAMVDEVKLVAPSRFLVAVPADQFARVGPELREWESQLAEYYRQVVDENGWSSVDQPRIRVAAGPELRGNTVMVSVDEEYLVQHGRSFRPGNRRGGRLSLLSSAAAMAVGLYLVVLLAAPDLIPSWMPTPSLPQPEAISAPSLADGWEAAQETAVRTVSDGANSLRRAAETTLPKRASGEVAASPGLTVRAGSPSRQGGVSPEGFLARGTVVHWWSFQEARGESIAGEDRWLEIGRAGPEWGDRSGQKLYVWMGGIEVR